MHRNDSEERKESQARKATGKAAPLLEWQTDGDENEWHARQSPADAGPPAARSWSMHPMAFVLVAFAFLTGALGWTWYRAEQGVAQIEAELRESVEVDLWTSPQESQATNLAFTTADVDPLHPLSSTVQIVALTEESALVRLILQPGPNQPSLRQARVYRRSGIGWQRIAPTREMLGRELWGASRHLQTQYFDFHYYALDEEAVTVAAPMVDGFYASFSAAFLSSTGHSGRLTAARIQVEVDPTIAYGAIAKRPNPAAPLVVASPATYLAPVELSEADLLAQALLLSLLSESAAQTISARWQPLGDALFLWQLWQAELPLTSWREPLVTWVMDALANPQAHSSVGEPAFAPELCAQSKAWMMAPLEMKIPILCDNHLWAEEYLTAWRAAYQPPLTLTQLVPGVPVPVDYALPLKYNFRPVHPGSAVLLTTVIDYVVITYGQDHLALLLTKLPEHQSWETLVPALFGISAADFEAGWQSYLEQRYAAYPSLPWSLPWAMGVRLRSCLFDHKLVVICVT